MSAPTSYQLIIDVENSVRIAVGRLGAHDFPAGRYVYTGSAKRALEARIARHLRTEKTPHWHIDHLLAASGVTVLDVRRFARGECALNCSTRGTVIVAGFGSSDCRAGCRSHLKFVVPNEAPDDARRPSQRSVSSRRPPQREATCRSRPFRSDGASSCRCRP